MLKIKNTSGEEIMTLHDDNTEEFASKKIKEAYEQAKLEQKDEG